MRYGATRTTLVVAAIGALACVTVAASADGPRPAVSPGPSAERPDGRPAAGSHRSEPPAPPLGLVRSAVQSAVGDVQSQLPDWAKRIELEWDLGVGKADYGVLTVQPLYRSDDLADTIFTQIRLAWVENDRFTTNLGVGYRRLLWNERLMLGGNLFFDSDWTEDHRRLGVGAELRSSAFELNLNLYDPLTGKHSVGDGFQERALGGFGVEVGAQVPYLRWAHVFAGRTYWNSIDSKDIHDTTVSLRMRLLPFLEIEAGRFDDNVGSPTGFVNVRLSFGGRPGPAASQGVVDRVPFRLTSMRDHTLDRVRREDNIRVERTRRTAGGTVSITVGRK